MSKRIVSALALATAALIVPAQAHAQAAHYTLDPASTLSVSGSSTVRGWTCTARVLDTTAVAGASTTLADAIATAMLAVPVANLDCGSGTMEGHLRRAMNAERHPTIRFRLDRYTVAGPADGRQAVDVSGNLTINGQTRPVTARIEAIRNPDGSIQATGEVPLDMTQYGVTPPSLMMGTLKVRKDVTIAFDLGLNP
jgi:polyisoprenoid-binding protein YceI